MSSHCHVNKVEPRNYLFVRHSLACVALLLSIICDGNYNLCSMFTVLVCSFETVIHGVDKAWKGSGRGSKED